MAAAHMIRLHDPELCVSIYNSFEFLYYCSSTVVSILPLPPHGHPHLPPLILPRFGSVHVSFIHVP